MCSLAFLFFSPEAPALHSNPALFIYYRKHTSKIYVFGIMSGITKSSAPRVASDSGVLLCNPKQFQSNVTSSNPAVELFPAPAGTIRQDAGPTFRTEPGSILSLFSIQATGLKPEQARSCCCCCHPRHDIHCCSGNRHGSGKQTPKHNCWLFLIRVITARLIGAHRVCVSRPPSSDRCDRPVLTQTGRVLFFPSHRCGRRQQEVLLYP